MQQLITWSILCIYAALTLWLSWIGMRRTSTFKAYAIGGGQMGPVVCGITMASSIASTATFVINPGFVYVHGLSALLHYGLAAFCGAACALILLTSRFRRIGASQNSLTIPQWICHRYGSRGLATFFALINLFSLSFVVLILVGCAIIMSNLLGISHQTALTMTLVFVFSYVIMGGTWAHAYTNVLQSVFMVAISVAFLFSGIQWLDGDLPARFSALGPALTSVYNPDSNLYFDFFSVFASGFIITFALMMQPHILSKALYLKKQKSVRSFIVTTLVVYGIFVSMLLVGFYARFAGLDVARQDHVVMHYLNHLVDTGWMMPWMMSFVSVALLAAGMSTLDGILVSLSSMVVADLWMPWSRKTGNQEKTGLALSRWVLFGIGIIAFLLALDPPAEVGLFAQKGVYGLVAASFVPILAGTLVTSSPGSMPVWLISSSAVTGLATHLILSFIAGVENPAVAAALAILSSAILFSLGKAAVAIQVRQQRTSTRESLSVG